MTALRIMMGFGGGPSFLCEDPIVPTNCVGARRTKGNMCFGSRGVTEFPWQTPSPGIWVTEDAERDRGALPVVQNPHPRRVLHQLCQLGGAVRRSYSFQSRRWRGDEVIKGRSSCYPDS